MEALVGTMLKLHPQIIVDNGKMRVKNKYRGKDSKIFKQYIQDKIPEFEKSNKKRIFVNRTGCDEELFKELFDYVKSLAIFEEVLPNNAGSVISSHSGPNTFAVHFIYE